MISLDDFKLDSPAMRIGILIFVPFILFTILAIQLWNMQVYHNGDYVERSKQQSVRTIRIPAIRGRILARDGTALADNRVSYDVKLHLSELRMRKRMDMVKQILTEAELIAKRIGRTCTLTQEQLLQHMNLYPGIPLDLFKDLNQKELGALWEIQPRLHGLDISAEPVRCYPNGPLASQIIGYVGASDPKQADDRAEYFYYIADLAGKSGLERIYDEKLRGSAGSKLVMVDSSGFIHGLVEPEREARHGFDVVLTLDIAAQRTAERLLRTSGYNGALVLLNAENGEVLAMASYPGFDPAEFIPKISAARYQQLIQDPAHPFLNRAAMGAYLPGSIVKPLTALACLKAGISPEHTVNCTGKTPHGYGSGIHCNSRYGHGPMTVSDAIKKSCNVYFIDEGVSIGISALSKMFASAGIGSKTGIEIPEYRGILPRDSEFWQEEETAYVAFGQGRIALSPLQAAVYTAALANGGTRWTPHIVRRIIDSSAADSGPLSIYDVTPEESGKLDASPEALRLVQDAMHRVVHERGGSGVKAATPAIELYGKTGTADIVTKQGASKNVWFTCFGRDPERKTLYALTLVLEKGVSGGGTAAPLAGRFFTEWFAAR